MPRTLGGIGCSRSEDTFEGGASKPGEGAFIVNISGPVRAIRSYLGANSYLYTVNTHDFYPDREDLTTDIRGHAGLPGYGSPDDYITNTAGLNIGTVYQDRNPASPAQCTGDGAMWGQNGVNLVSSVFNVPVTDPTLTATPGKLVVHRVRWFHGANRSTADAASLDTQARNPIQVTVSG